MKCSRKLSRRQTLTFLALFSILAICSSGYYLTQIRNYGQTTAGYPLGAHRPSAVLPPAPIVLGVVEPGKIYTRTLIIASLHKEDTSWARELARDDPNLTAAIYLVDRPGSSFSVPKNKGHEVMVYLTYIIDHYNTLNDVSIFMHAHLITWHNNDMLDSNSANMVKRLRSEKVITDGYMNLRCHWEPGCPTHIHPTTNDNDLVNIPEAAVIGMAWQQLFPNTHIPRVLSQPCCAQFAVSADRIRRLPRETYIFYRDWLLRSPLSDDISGRVWEYIWQYVFAGDEEYCPEEHICYCEGYGVCFADKDQYDYFYQLKSQGEDFQHEIDELKVNETVPIGSEQAVNDLRIKIAHLVTEMDKIKAEVLKGGI